MWQLQEAVLGQLMSVFTFWGVGLVRRDDAASAALLQVDTNCPSPSQEE